MKKTLIALCGAFALAAFAEPEGPAPADHGPKGQCEKCEGHGPKCEGHGPKGECHGPKCEGHGPKGECRGPKGECQKGECHGKKGQCGKGPRALNRPLTINLDTATPEEIEQFKKDVLDRIDKAVADKDPGEKCGCGKDDCTGGPDCKCGDENCDCASKRGPRNVVVFVNNGMRPNRMGGKGGPGMRGGPDGKRGGHGMRGGRRGGPKGGAPAPEAPAPDAPPAE